MEISPNPPENKLTAFYYIHTAKSTREKFLPMKGGN